jgi:hypothetical protein
MSLWPTMSTAAWASSRVVYPWRAPQDSFLNHIRKGLFCPSKTPYHVQLRSVKKYRSDSIRGRRDTTTRIDHLAGWELHVGELLGKVVRGQNVDTRFGEIMPNDHRKEVVVVG